MGTLVAGDLDFDRNGKTTGRNSYVSKLLTRTITKIINVSPLLNHNLAGVCGNLYTLAMGSVDNTLRFEASPETAGDVGAGDLCEAGVERSCGVEHYRCADWTVSGRTNEFAALFDGIEPDLAGKDPVALDVLAIQELDRERQERKIQPGNDNPDLYKNASYFLELGVGDPAKIRIEMAK